MASRKHNPFLCKPLEVSVAQSKAAPGHGPATQSSSPSNSPSSSSSSSSSESAPASPSKPPHAPPPGLQRHLSLFDLVALGLGGTIGSGIFVLSGFIAKNYAGPAASLSFLLSGVCALLSGCCYAELSAVLPISGSSYNYVYVASGEYFALLASACLTLEYLVSGAAVSRSWGDKLLQWLTEELGAGEWVQYFVNPFGPDRINPMAGVLAAAVVYLLARGVKESKNVSNFMTCMKVGVVLFMTIGGFCLFKSSNLSPYVPPQYGVSGVLRGATSSFFAYLGYDEICAFAGEAVDPVNNVPKAILITIGILSTLYFLAATALTGMQPITAMSDTGGFAAAFHYNGSSWAAQLCSVGEVLTLPLVVLVSLMGQPRVTYAMSVDGLLPPFFKDIDYSKGEGGNLTNGTLAAGAAMVAIATFVPFKYLNDMISAGVLVSFSLTDTSLILIRRETRVADHPHLLRGYLVAFNALSFFLGVVGTRSISTTFGKVATSFMLLGLARLSHLIATRCPEKSSLPRDHFKTPLVPYLPCFAIVVNWLLVGQLEWLGILLLIVYMAAVSIFYFSYSIKHSVGNNVGWALATTEGGRSGSDEKSSEEELDFEGDSVGLLLSSSSSSRNSSVSGRGGGKKKNSRTSDATTLLAARAGAVV